MCERRRGCAQGWAGILVPVHSQEWKPLIPVPELWEWIFSSPSRSWIMGMGFFHHLSVPEMWESQVFGFFYSLPIPEFAISQTGIKTGIGLLWETRLSKQCEFCDYGQPDREISVFFTPSLKHLTNSMYEAIIYCISGEAHSYSHQQNTRDQIALHRSKVVIINKINSIWRGS